MDKGHSMIRFVIGLFIFAVALCAYIINTQHGGILPTAGSNVETASTAPVETITLPQDQPVDDTAAQIVNSIVSRDLGFPTASIAVGAAVRDTLAILGLEISGGITSPPDQRFATLIGDALKAGTPDTQIAATVIDTARAGGLAVPAGLVTADQKIDVTTFLKAVVTTAVLATEGTDPVVPDLSNDPTAIITANGYDYVIAPSDSLAAIAVKFYGDVTQTSRLIQANPIALAQPDQLTAGTTISIPAF
jgi:nucleoid-associated protein YgaU